jgi:ubiquitin-protein ligase
MNKHILFVYQSVLRDPYEGKMNVRVYFDDETNILYVEYIGHNDSPYIKGQYFFSMDITNYPLAPPKLRFLTENGRFRVDHPISASITEVHAEQWTPAINLYSLICAIISMFHDDNVMGIGHLHDNKEKRLMFAKESYTYNLEHNSKLVNLFATKGIPSYEQQETAQEYDKLRQILDKETNDVRKQKLKERIDFIKSEMDTWFEKLNN